MSRVGRIVVALAVVVGLGACGGGDDDDEEARTVQPGAPGEQTEELSDEEAAAVDAPAHTEADTRFMQDMIVHHRQALAMTALVAERSESPDIPVFAERITLSQEAEIDQIEQWLTDRGEAVPDPADPADAADHALMPGMATAEQMAQLEQARGAAFDRLFLDLMIVHHQGALTMVDELYAAGGGLEPAVDQFAIGVTADQTIEIGRMQDLRAALG